MIRIIARLERRQLEGFKGIKRATYYSAGVEILRTGPFVDALTRHCHVLVSEKFPVVLVIDNTRGLPLALALPTVSPPNLARQRFSFQRWVRPVSQQGTVQRRRRVWGLNDARNRVNALRKPLKDIQSRQQTALGIEYVSLHA